MKQGRMQLGSLTLLFTVLMLCVSVLAVLCLSTAKADLSMARSYGDHAAALSRCESAGQQWLSQVDSALADGSLEPSELPANTTLSDGTLSAVLQDGGVSLTIRLQLSEGGYRILQWTKETQWTQDTNLNLW